MDVTSSASVGIPFTPSARPQATAPDAGTVVLGFEGIPSVTPLPTDAYAAQGVTVSGAIVLTAPFYNWFSRPPHSGSGVITGDIDPPSGTPVTITFAFDQAYTSAEVFITSTQPVELRCTDDAGQSVGAAFSRAPNLAGGDPGNIYPPNDHVQVTGAGIRGCTITGPSNRFVVDDVTLTNKGKGGVRLLVSTPRLQVLPVTLPGQIFDARTQIAFDSVRHVSPAHDTTYTLPTAARRDSLLLTIQMQGTDSLPRPGTITLISEPRDSSGGHHHGVGHRPRGTFYPLGANVSTDPGQRDSITISTDDSGYAKIIYRTSGIGGIEVVRLRGSAAPDTVTDSLVVTVKVPDLQLVKPTAYMDTVGGVTPHPVAHWATPQMDLALQVLAESISVKRRALDSAGIIEPTDTFPAIFSVNDISLESGGVLDLAQDWSNAHRTHRKGTDADVRVHRGEPWDLYDHWVTYYWVTIMRHRINPERATLNHEHLTF